MPRSILVVEDEALIAFDIQSALVGFGYDVPATMATAREAMQAVETFRPDLVLMDVHLKGGDDGVVAAAAIQACRPTPVVFLTGYADDETVERAGGVESYGYLLKPFNDRELRATVEIALRRHAHAQRIVQRTTLLAGVLGSLPDIVLSVDTEGRVLLANDAALGAVGATSAGESTGWTGGAPGLRLPDGETVCPPDQLPLSLALCGKTVHDAEVFVQAPSEVSGRLYHFTAAPLRDESGRVTGAVTVGRDITGLRATQSDLRQLSDTDELTGAYNRRGFFVAARAKLDAATSLGRTPALVFVDLNELKRINDELGHQEGDRAIADAAEVLRSSFRKSDIVGRLGGDEFVVLAQDAGPYSHVLRGRLQSALDEFNERSDRPYRLSMSVGLSQQDPTDPVSLEALVEQADKRMYEEKASHRRRYSGMARVAPVGVEDDSRNVGAARDLRDKSAGPGL
ncbi:MAG: diguanylate cyclase [Polyangiaceae bacterium]